MRIVLDAGPLGLISNPGDTAPVREAYEWAVDRVTAGAVIVVPEIADYEVRREVIRAGNADGVARLDRIGWSFAYDPLTTGALRLAAVLWADARRGGRPTAPDHALDGDVILAAQARALAERTGDDVVVATTNTRHLERYVDARRWSEI